MKLQHMILPIALALAGVAYASNCPNLMSEIDAALAEKPNIDEATMREVKELRAQGQAEHAAGQHDLSEETLTEVLELLGKL